MSEWQPIETAPTDGTWVLTSDGKHIWSNRWIRETTEYWETVSRDTKKLRREESGRWDEWPDAAEYPTHWMPLPPLPTPPAEKG